MRAVLAIIAMAIALATPALNPKIPDDVSGPPTQDNYDNLSWQLFVAMNWPIGNSTVPRVWERYTDPIDIFQSSSLCADEKPSDTTKRLRMARDKTGSVGGLDIQAGSNWPLIDRDGNFALVEVAVNDVLKNYLTANGLTTARGFQQYVQRRSIRFPDRSMELKAAWRLFPENTDPRILARYYTRKAVICVAKKQSSTGQPLKIQGTVGLVGFHIVYKTKNQPKWIWSTFEQVDNYEATYKPLAGLQPTFAGGAGTDPNRQPKPAPGSGALYQWSAAQPTAGLYSLTHAARAPNEPALPAAVNARWQAALAGTPFEYYRLNATQWFDAKDRLQPKNADGVAILRNSTLETYLLGDQTIAAQIPTVGPVASDPTFNPPNSTLADTIVATMAAAATPEKTGPNTWSSCVICHQMAMYQYGPSGGKDSTLGGAMTDFSFIFRSNLASGGAMAGSNQQSVH